MSESRPNVLFVVADDLRWDAIGCAGNDVVRTPALDRLADRSCQFTRAYNMGSEHGAVCVPARGMIHSGRSLFRLDGPRGIPVDDPTLPGQFSQAGYRTIGTGKWHNEPESFNACFEDGRDVFFGGMANHWNVPVTDRHPLGEYPRDRPHPQDPGDTRGIQPFRQILERYSSGTHSSELFASAMIEELQAHHRGDDDRPFFGYVAFTAPHDPRTAPGEYHLLYDPQEIQLPPNFEPEHPFDNGNLRGRDEDLAGHPREPDEIRRHIADYYAIISHLDAQLSRLLDTLERIGVREETIVVFTADHGLAVGRHGLMGKQNVYEHSVRIPLLIDVPDGPEGETREAFTYHQDLFPTLCELADLPIPDGLEGHSLEPAIRERGNSVRDSVFTAFGSTQRAIRTDRYKLIENFVNGTRHTQLFDLYEDPHETTNLATAESNTETVERLRSELSQRRCAFDDPTV